MQDEQAKQEIKEPPEVKEDRVPVEEPPKREDENDKERRDPEEPAPGIEHYPEPDAENIMPVEDRPGTM